MTISGKSVPIRWPAGPLEAGLREKNGGLSAEAKETFQKLLDPAALQILAGTPINCLVVAWAGGTPLDATQQQILAPLVRQASAAGLAVVGLIEPSATRDSAIAAAKAGGLAAVACAEATAVDGVTVLPYADRSKLPWNSSAPVVLVRDNVWPGIPPKATAAATGGPWIDSNGWFLQLARARCGAKPLWLLADPPAKTILRTPSYLRALADIHQRGGHWVISLDDQLRAGLLSGNSVARGTFTTLAGGVTFFQNHAAWNDYEPAGVVGVVSDFDGPNEFLATETLNLLARRNLPYRIILKQTAEAASFASLHALVYVDEQPPAPALHGKMVAFARGGGFLLVGNKWDAAGSTPTPSTHPRFSLRSLGKGRLAVSKSDSPDPYELANDCHILMGREYDVIRFFNISAMTSAYTLGRSRALLHIVNYGMRVPGDLVTVWFREPYRTARLWCIGSEKPELLKTAPVNGGVEVYLPSVQTYSAVELEKG